MVTSKVFIREVAASEDTVFEVAGNIDGGLQLVLENLSDTNTLVYKFQESYDGIEWVDKTFSTSGNQTATTFTVLPLGHHELKVLYTRQKLRMRASGNLLAQLSLQYRSPSTVGVAPTVNPW